MFTKLVSQTSTCFKGGQCSITKLSWLKIIMVINAPHGFDPPCLFSQTQDKGNAIL